MKTRHSALSAATLFITFLSGCALDLAEIGDRKQAAGDNECKDTICGGNFLLGSSDLPGFMAKTGSRKGPNDFDMVRGLLAGTIHDVEFDRDRLRLVHQNTGAEVTDDALIGAKLHLYGPSHEGSLNYMSWWIKIIDVDTTSYWGDSEEAMTSYAMVIKRSDETGYRPLCNAEANCTDSSCLTDESYATMVVGHIDEETGVETGFNGVPAQNWFRFSCYGEALYKMKKYQYDSTLWASEPTTPEQRSAAFKMITGRYCPTGDTDNFEGYTTGGIAFRYHDKTFRYPWVGDGFDTDNFASDGERPLKENTVLEAVWDHNGAKCLNTPRYKSHAEVESSCGTVPNCTDAPDPSLPQNDEHGVAYKNLGDQFIGEDEYELASYRLGRNVCVDPSEPELCHYPSIEVALADSELPSGVRLAIYNTANPTTNPLVIDEHLVIRSIDTTQPWTIEKQSDSSRMITVLPGVHLTLSYINLTNPNDHAGGGIDNNGGHLALINTDITDQRTTSTRGAALHNRNGGHVYTLHSNFRHNSTWGDGGAIATDTGSLLSLSTAFLEHNQANNGAGGGIFCDNAEVVLENTRIKYNSSHNSSGMRAQQECTVTMTESKIKQNVGNRALSVRTDSVATLVYDSAVHSFASVVKNNETHNGNSSNCHTESDGQILGATSGCDGGIEAN